MPKCVFYPHNVNASFLAHGGISLQEFADNLSIPFIETSAKQRINVDEAFSNLVREIRRYNKVSRLGIHTYVTLIT